MSTFRVTVVLLWLCSVSAFMHPKTMPRQKPSQRTLQRQRAPAALSAAFEGFLVADGGIENFKQYVPLATCSLVLIDIALGRPVANGLASALYKGADNQPNQTPEDLLKGIVSQDGGSRVSQSGDAGSSNPSKARINVDAVTTDAMKKAEESLLRVKYAENMKPQKGSLDEARKRLARQLEELG